MTINGKTYPVIDTCYDEDRESIIHFIDEGDLGEPGELKVGDAVDMEINWKRRHRLMRMHSSLHLVCSLIKAQATGGSVGEYESRLDFDLQDEVVDKEKLNAALNELVSRGVPLSIGSISDAELEQNPELVRTMSVQPPRGQGSVRTITIEGVDYQPCGGTHVKNTAEIGELLVSKVKNKGKQNKRITITLVNP